MSERGQPGWLSRHVAAREVLAIALLAGLILGLNFPSLGYGLFMDDHAHYRQLRDCDWSLRGLTDACRLELIGGVLDVWFLPECTLRFFRPLAFGVMKLTYALSGWDPAAMHAASLAWHLLACTLLMRLLRKMGGTFWLAWAVAAMFAMHPGQVAAVQWIACQTELMVTTFLLGAALCYLRFRGWSEPDGDQANSRPRYGSAVACAVLFLAALGCRENAVMFPVVMLGVEHLMWRRRTRTAVGLLATLSIVAGAYLAVRWIYLADAAVPPRPYVMPPGDPDFLRYVFDKACYYLLGEFLLAPSVPFAGLEYLRERPLTFYGLTIGVVALLVLVYWRCGWRKPGLLGLAWLMGFMLPVLPVFASPHHLYLPGIGWAITAMLVLRSMLGPVETARWPRRSAVWAGILGLGVGFGTLTFYFAQVMDVGQRVEDQVAAEVASTPGGLKDGDTIYVANLPIIAHYVGLAVEERTGLRNLHVRLLTWAPRVLGLVGSDVRSELTWLSNRSIEVRVAAGRYFDGPMGRLVSEASGRPVPTQTAGSLAKHGFRAEVLAHDSEGVSALRFTFATPLSGAGIHLFWGSRVLWAFETRPEGKP
jgi:hypothetical protein